MSIGRERKVESRFVRRATKGAGVGIEDAVAAAEARIDDMRDGVRERIGEMIGRMQGALGPMAAPDALRVLRADADALVGLCGPFGLPEIEKVALSLCKLYDACQPDLPSTEGVRVHLDAMQLFWLADRDTAALAGPQVLEGLRQVVAAARRQPSA